MKAQLITAKLMKAKLMKVELMSEPQNGLDAFEITTAVSALTLNICFSS